MRRSGIYRCGGMTLVEIVVAVGITLGMLLLIGTVFKSATDASGSAMAHNEVMSQVRTLTNQIEQDLSGLRPDMPMAIIFEAYPDDPDEPDKLVRYDRICFFANGNFQPSYAVDLSGNLARIYYGQMHNSPPSGFRDRPVSPPRQILARRFKILTADTAVPTPADWVSLGPSTAGEIYDYDFFEQTSASFWKNQPSANYVDYYFNQNSASVVSMVRPVDYEAVRGTTEYYMNGLPVGAHPVGIDPYGEDALQRLIFLSDVTDFKIQIYLEDKTQGRWRWYPDDQDMIRASSSGLPGPVAFYWNTPDLDPGSDYYIDKNMIAWFCDKDPGMVDFWPKAIRFTFTLYDKNRRRFGEGQTFSYIMKIPPKY